MTKLLALAPAALLAACGDPAPPAPPANASAGEGGYIARVRALPQGQLRGVLFRSIRDGGKDCPQLSGFTPAPDDAGRPVWNATCTDGGRWRITLGDDGTAIVTGAGAR